MKRARGAGWSDGNRRAIVQRIAITVAAVLVGLGATLGHAVPASAAARIAATSQSAGTATAVVWQYWDSYSSYQTCRTVGGLGIVGGLWTDYSCSYIPTSAEPWWLFVNM
jgi:hypothetical protein